jgi:hypothetical protein
VSSSQPSGSSGGASTGGAGGSGGDDRPLTDSEFQLVQRLFSDPFSFPLSFKTWLVSYLEASDMILPQSSVEGLSRKLKDLSNP